MSKSIANRLFLSASLAVLTLCVQAAYAGAPTDNASNSYEYQAYVNAYSAWAMVINLPEAIDDNILAVIDENGSINEWEALETELFWTEQFVGYVDAAFSNAYEALDKDDDSYWDPCVDNLLNAIDSGELLLQYMEVSNYPNSSRRQAVESSLYYLNIAIENASFAALTGSSGFSTNSFSTKSVQTKTKTTTKKLSSPSYRDYQLSSGKQTKR